MDGACSATLDRARLLTYVTDPTKTVHRLTFQLWDWCRATISIDLPAEAIVRQARINGADVSPFSSARAVGKLRLLLPAPAGPRRLSIEVIYTTSRNGIGPLTHLKDAAPVLPAAPGQMRRIYCLPPTTTPLDPKHWRQLPNTAQFAGQPGRTVVNPQPGAGPEPWGAVITRWAMGPDTGSTVVLDLWALDAAGIDPASPARGAGRRLWEAAGLTVVAGDGVLLLTDRSVGDGIPRTWAQAVATAASRGFDPSGRFRRGIDWVRDDDTVAAGPGLIPEEIASGSYWESITAPAATDGVWVVDARGVDFAGGFIAVAGMAVALLGRKWRPGVQWAGLAAWFGGASTAVIWLPGPIAAAARWPLLAAVLATGWKLLPAVRRNATPVVPVARANLTRALTAAVVLAGWLGAGGWAAAPGPVMVFLVPGPPEAPKPRTVLVPGDLLDKLSELGSRSRADLDGTAWLDARYDGQVIGGQARFTAVLRLHSFSDNPPPLPLPMAGVQIGDAKLDGTPAFLRSEGDRYLVPVRGRGPHTLELTLTAMPTGTRDDRELRFAIPEIPTSHLSFIGPVAGADLQVVSARGSEDLTVEAGRPRVDADLGGVNTVRVRCAPPGSTAAGVVVRSRETYLWDLTASAARLLGVIRFDIGPGSVSALSVSLPKDLEVAAVNARPVDAGITGWLRSWQVAPPAVAGGRRSLILAFSGPITGQWQANLELTPHTPFGPSFSLGFPAAIGARSAPPIVAWRAAGIDLSDSPPRAANPLTPDTFMRDHWLPAKFDTDARPPTRAYQRKTAGPAPAACILRLPPPRAIERRSTSRGKSRRTMRKLTPSAGSPIPMARYRSPNGSFRRGSQLRPSAARTFIPGPAAAAVYRSGSPNRPPKQSSN